MAAALIAAGVTVAGAALKKTPGTGPTAGMHSTPFESWFDSSGWTVNVGSGSATTNQGKNAAVPGAEIFTMLQNPMVLAVVAVVVILYLKKK